ncbi:MAG: carbohydrate kinase family protein [Acidimicrobiales bacterium]
MSRVALIGDVVLDVAVVARGPVAPTSDTPADIRLGRGGSSANIATHLAARGHEVTFIGAVGDDAAGRLVRDELVAAGVHARLVQVAAPTGVVVALVDADGQRSMRTRRGAASALSAEHVAAGLAGPVDHLHVSGYTLVDPATRAIGAAALRAQADWGASTSVDVCSIAPWREAGADAFLVASAGAGLLFANQEEAELMGAGPLEAALATLAARYPEVVVTRGPAGAVARRGAAEAVAPARPTRVVDTTGAGDAATAGYLDARLRGLPLAACLDAAVEEAARVVAVVGPGAQSRR